MDWKSARTKLTQSKVTEAADWVQDHCPALDFSNLYVKTKCHPPRCRYVEFQGQTYPAKAFGYLVLIQAGWSQKEDYRPTVNEVVSPIRRFNVREA